MDISLVIAILSIVGTLINTYFQNRNKQKIENASARKLNIEGDEMLFAFKNKIIAELQQQIDEVKKELQLVKEQNAIHITEKIRLEVRIEGLVEENNLLKNKLLLDSKIHKQELDSLKNRIYELNKDLQQYKKNHNHE